MILKAVAELKGRNGSSKAAILKYLMAHYKLGDNTNKIETQLRMAHKKAVMKGGEGDRGIRKLQARWEKDMSKKSAVREHKSPSKAASEKPKAEKKTKSPKKAKVPKAKAAKTRPASKTAKPKKAKNSKTSSSKAKKAVA
ncbi:hypothetical protein KIN20_035201 [Parelaphostrongylus tenuis]|uniref:H15 domain-containing protein n=1 Tax=Parelaphostrongylus tenuis TaxID=148309 RepID=A0AAD5RB75_PARTN|nr:hypothetical protein KIN20_035201 [Parelaphostrongylus tenuis]